MSYFSAGNLTRGAVSLAASVAFAAASVSYFRGADTLVEQAKKEQTVTGAVAKMKAANDKTGNGYLTGFCSVLMLGSAGMTLAARRKTQAEASGPAPRPVAPADLG